MTQNCHGCSQYRGWTTKELYLGNLDAKRDWGHAKEYVEGMWKILQHKKGDDFVLATGRSETVSRFVELAFAQVGRSIDWEGHGMNEVVAIKKVVKYLLK